ncbi:hypothetical protein Rs2_41348 [Raphanus sativus]|nr:hypothetical protein Rs2_41348 [Raphanus sativus]
MWLSAIDSGCLTSLLAYPALGDVYFNTKIWITIRWWIILPSVRFRFSVSSVLRPLGFVGGSLELCPFSAGGLLIPICLCVLRLLLVMILSKLKVMLFLDFVSNGIDSVIFRFYCGPGLVSLACFQGRGASALLCSVPWVFEG